MRPSELIKILANAIEKNSNVDVSFILTFHFLVER